MACPPSTGQCFSSPPPGFTCGAGAEECPVLCDPFSVVFDFRETGTGGRLNGCFVGIWQNGDSALGEQRDGRWCSYGCPGSFGDYFECDDAQGFLTKADTLDGRRWLLPHPTLRTTRNVRDAFGAFHSLLSNSYHPVSRETTFLRGTCWFNFGTECFNSDTGHCFRRGGYFDSDPNSRLPDQSQVGCGVQPREALTFIQPDSMMRIGWGWAPTVLAGSNSNSQAQGSYYCRKFQDARQFNSAKLNHNEPATVTISAGSWGGLPGAVESFLEPVHLSTNTCNSNLMVPCTAEIAKPPVDCFTAAWFTRGPGSGPAHDVHYNVDSRDRFDFLQVRPRQTDPMRIDPCTGATPLQVASAEFKTQILQFIMGNTIGGVTFDRVDNGVNTHSDNSFVGRYDRGYFGPPVEIPGFYGPCRLTQSGCPVTCRMFIESARMAATLVVFRLRATHLDASQDDLFEPHVRFGIYVSLKTTAELDDGCVLDTWDGRQIPLSLDGLDVVPAVDSIVFKDIQNRSIIPPIEAHWLGFLGKHSKPTARSFRRQPLITEATCDEVARMIQRQVVPGWPTRAESSVDDPRGTYQGMVEVSLGDPR